MKKVAISGYFNPIHSGHLDYIKEAKALGDYLVVIINSDKQVALKGSVPFMDENERARILTDNKYVDEVFISIDVDRSVCKSLEAVKPDIFANGGDRFSDNVPENGVCAKLGIKTVFQIGGAKNESSSTLIKRASYHHLEAKRPWGKFKILFDGLDCKVKKLIVKPKQKLSLQSHKFRDEHWIVTQGTGLFTIGSDINPGFYGKYLYVPRGCKHRIENISSTEYLTLIEVQTGTYFGEDDIIRYEDIYDRI